MLHLAISKNDRIVKTRTADLQCVPERSLLPAQCRDLAPTLTQYAATCSIQYHGRRKKPEKKNSKHIASSLYYTPNAFHLEIRPR